MRDWSLHIASPNLFIEVEKVRVYQAKPNDTDWNEEIRAFTSFFELRRLRTSGKPPRLQHHLSFFESRGLELKNPTFRSIHAKCFQTLIPSFNALVQTTYALTNDHLSISSPNLTPLNLLASFSSMPDSLRLGGRSPLSCNIASRVAHPGWLRSSNPSARSCERATRHKRASSSYKY